MSPEDQGFKVTDRRRRDEEPGTGSDPGPKPGAERSLAGLFMMLASEAVIALGDAPDPATGEQRRELPHAAGMIDLLLLLRERTEGNRTTEEAKVLEDLLYDLQLRYVRATKSAG